MAPDEVELELGDPAGDDHVPEVAEAGVDAINDSTASQISSTTARRLRLLPLPARGRPKHRAGDV
jgi:hypothetical protein